MPLVRYDASCPRWSRAPTIHAFYTFRDTMQGHNVGILNLVDLPGGVVECGDVLRPSLERDAHFLKASISVNAARAYPAWTPNTYFRCAWCTRKCRKDLHHHTKEYGSPIRASTTLRHSCTAIPEISLRPIPGQRLSSPSPYTARQR